MRRTVRSRVCVCICMCLFIFMFGFVLGPMTGGCDFRCFFEKFFDYKKQAQIQLRVKFVFDKNDILSLAAKAA